MVITLPVLLSMVIAVITVSPTELGTWNNILSCAVPRFRDLVEGNGGTPKNGAMHIIGAHAFLLSATTHTLRVLDIAAGDNPVIVASLTLPEGVTSLSAKVTAVSGNTISATTSWGAMNINWSVNVLSSTNIVRKFGSVSPLAEIKVGDILSFTGTVTSGTNTSIVIDAKVVKNWSVTKQNVRSKIEGTVKSVAGTVAPTTMVVTSNSKDYTVNVATNTSIVNDNWANTTLASFVVGNKVTAYGVVNDTTLSVAATVLRNESI
jgi:hypothetical protein